MSYMEDLLLSKTACFGFVGVRGVSKSWSAQYVLEVLSDNGWKPLLIDPKGEDEAIHLPAQDLQAEKLKTFGLEPKGFKTRYLTFRFPLGMENVPMNYELEPLSVRMLSFGHFRTLSGFFSEGEGRELFDAYLLAGGESASIEDIITALLRRKGPKASPRVLSLLISLFSDKSPFEPENLLEIVSKYDFTVISTGYFKPSARDLALFSLNIVFDNLASYLVQNIVPMRMIIHVRELREVAPREGAMGSQWHLRERIGNLVTFLRQAKTAVTRFSFEVQNVKSIPKIILENSYGLFVHPFNFKDASQRKELEKFFPIPESVIRSTAALENVSHGTWIYISKDGHAEYVTIPPPRSLRIPEPADLDDATRLAGIYSQYSPRRSLEKEAEEIRMRYKYWIARAKVLRMEGKREEKNVPLAEIGQPPPTVIPSTSLPKQLSAVVVFCSLFGNNDGATFSTGEIWKFYKSIFGARGGKLYNPSYIRDAIARPKNQRYLNVIGIKAIRSIDGEFFFKVESKERLLSHFKLYGEHYMRRIGLTKEILSNHVEGFDPASLIIGR